MSMQQQKGICTLTAGNEKLCVCGGGGGKAAACRPLNACAAQLQQLALRHTVLLHVRYPPHLRCRASCRLCSDAPAATCAAALAAARVLAHAS